MFGLALALGQTLAALARRSRTAWR